MIKQMGPELVTTVHELWNRAAESRDIIHKPLSAEKFVEKLVAAEADELKYNLVYERDGRVVGFGNAYHKLGSDLGYVTYVLVVPELRRQGIGSEILTALEAKLKEYQSIKRINLNFFNPINLEWLIPNTPNHDHPNAPGVDVESPALPFFAKHGYKETARQYSYYRLLEGFQFQPKIRERQEAMQQDDITVTYYDPAKHFGFDELFTNLANEDWRQKIMDNINCPKPYPVLVVEQRGRIGGFTGPLYVQESGRGYFAGIGIHSDFRLHGAGSVLFSCLCQG
ncbi:MAG: GNAT family N-acetyltransferase, partial [Bacillota bacterium]